MTAIQRDGYRFSVDIQRARAYSKAHALCDCPCCRNYYAQVRDRLPKLAGFLDEFGVDIARPDEAMSVEMDDFIDYIEVDYTVCGSVEAMGQCDIGLHDALPLNIVICDGFVSPNEQTGDYFTISITGIQLPWVLDEPFPKPYMVKRRGLRSIFQRNFEK